MWGGARALKNEVGGRVGGVCAWSNEKSSNRIRWPIKNVQSSLRSAEIFSRGWQPWRTQDHTLGRVRKIWPVWFIPLITNPCAIQRGVVERSYPYLPPPPYLPADPKMDDLTRGDMYSYFMRGYLIYDVTVSLLLGNSFLIIKQQSLFFYKRERG